MRKFEIANHQFILQDDFRWVVMIVTNILFVAVIFKLTLNVYIFAGLALLLVPLGWLYYLSKPRCCPNCHKYMHRQSGKTYYEKDIRGWGFNENYRLVYKCYDCNKEISSKVTIDSGGATV